MKKRPLFVIALFLKIIVLADAQEIATFSAFMHNKVLYNPAAAGTNENQFNASLISRLQWSGVKGAPISSLFWADYRFRPQNMAVSASVYQDRIGANIFTEYQGIYAYKIYLTEDIKLSMGLSAGASNIQIDPDKLKSSSHDDPLFTQNASLNTTTPKFGLGFYLYADKFYVSLSSPDLVVVGNSTYDLYTNSGVITKKRNYMAMTGYHFKLSEKYALNTNLFVRYNSITHLLQADLNVQFELTDYFWVGGTYSYINNHSLMAGTHLSSKVKFGYAYGFRPGSSISPFQYSHEFNLILMLDQLFTGKQN